MKNLLISLCVLVMLCNAVYSQCNTSYNIALGKPAYASSIENAGTPASNAFDGNTTTTRWSSLFSDPQYLYVDLGTAYPLCEVDLYWETALGQNFTIDISNDAVTWTTVATITGNVSYMNTISISGTGRYVRMNGTVRGTGYGYSLYEMQVYSSNATPSCPSSNMALGKTAVASSLESAGFPASNVNDGNIATRWSSAFSDPQYIYIDLGSDYALCGVNLFWETANGQNFTIDASNDLVTWTNLATVVGNPATTLSNSFTFTGSGQYVRMYGTTRNTGYGYSLYEMQIFGSMILPVSLTDFKGFRESTQSVELQWSTQQEENNKGFEIERSGDAKNFNTIGEVAGHGNSSTVENYSFIDQNAIAGINYYRLKQVDYDQQYQYSAIVPVDLSTADVLNIEVFPNPASDLLTVRSTNSELVNGINIYSLSGSLVAGYQDVSSRIFSIPIQNLRPGLYFVRVNTTSKTESFKIMKQ